jgi:hypothetical protein
MPFLLANDQHHVVFAFERLVASPHHRAATSERPATNAHPQQLGTWPTGAAKEGLSGICHEGRR